jgi:hypothetical protein
MGINLREALATLSRALPLVLFRAGIFVAGGFMVIIIFGMLVFASHLAGGLSPAVVIVATFMVLQGAWVSGRILDRFFLYRYQAAMLLMFSGCQAASPGLSPALGEVARFFPNYSPWAALNRSLRRALTAFIQGSGEFPVLTAAAGNKSFSRTIDRLAIRQLSQAILVLAFSRGNTDPERSTREGLSIYFRHGNESRRLARHWLCFSAAGLVFLFLCLALPNWFFFKSAGAPVEIGIVLAAVIAWLLHQAFVIPFVLAGISGSLLAETRGKTTEADLCEKTESPDSQHGVAG